MQRFLAELKRRNVFRVAAFYAGAGWLLVQIVTQVFPFFDVPGWAIRLSIAAIALGFPLALLLAWLYEITPQGLRRESELDPTQPRIGARGRTLDFMIIGVLGLIVIYFVLDKFLLAKLMPASAIERSVAVLPFANMSGDPGKEYFSDGLAEELINRIGQIPGLNVVGRTSSFQFKGKNEDLRTIGDKLHVGSILEGSVRSDGEHLRIAAQLVKAVDGYQLWSHSYDGQFKDIFAVQEQIAQAVAEALQATLLDPSQLVARPREANLPAYNAYLQGHFHELRHSADGIRKAIGFYDDAVRLDPDYARAYAGLSRAWFWFGEISGQDLDEDHAKARAAAQRAIALDPDLAEGHDALGQIHLYVDLDPRAAEREFRRAAELEPAAVEPKIGLASVLGGFGQLDGAVALQREASVRDPLLTSAQFNLAGLFSSLGRHAEARDAANKVLDLQPAGAGNGALLAAVEARAGNGDAALAAARQETDPDWRRYAEALAQQARGDKAAADAALADLIKQGGDDMAYQIATVYAFRADADNAFAWLERARARRDPGIMSMRQDAFLRELAGDPRFAALYSQLGLSTAPSSSAARDEARKTTQ